MWNDYRSFFIPLILLVLISGSVFADPSDFSNMTAYELAEFDHSVLDKKALKQYNKILKIKFEHLSLDELKQLSTKNLNKKSNKAFQKELDKKQKAADKAVYAEVIPVVDGKLVIQDVVNIGEQYDASQIFSAAEKWARKTSMFRKIGGEQNMMLILGGVQTHPTMGQLEAHMRSRPGLLSQTLNEEINLRLYHYYQTKGNTIRTLLIESDITLQFKNGKYRYTWNNMVYDHYNHYTGNQQRFYTGGNCKARGTFFEFQNVCSRADKARRTALLEIKEDTLQHLKEMESYILEQLNNPEGNDDW